MEQYQNQKKNDSQVGKILTKNTQKAVITLVLSMLLSAAVLDSALYISAPVGYSLGLKVLSNCDGDQIAFDVGLQAYLQTYEDDDAPLMQVVVDDFLWSNGDDLSDLRPAEKQVSWYVSQITDDVAIAVHDLRHFTRIAAVLGLITTLIVCVILATGFILL